MNSPANILGGDRMVEFMKPNYYLGVYFRKGPLFFLLNAKEVVKYEPYEVGTVSSGSTTNVITPEFSNGDRILEPPYNSVLYQAFVGIDPPEAEVYLNFPGTIGRYDLDNQRTTPGPVKWIDGVTSPFDEPSEESELITFRDLYPGFIISNESGRDIYANMAFHIAKFSWSLINDPDTIQKLIEGKKPVKLWGFIHPYSAPNWLSQMVSSLSCCGEIVEAMRQVGASNLFDYGQKLWSKVRGVK